MITRGQQGPWNDFRRSPSSGCTPPNLIYLGQTNVNTCQIIKAKAAVGFSKEYADIHMAAMHLRAVLPD
ncbi:hypothetical protein SK128_008148 [Halocaridina rubra]|uniref:Uncharacterized protein n=1 Tax=Halocaridina rubra TaxID=373956 RepID=A0AAN9FU32_HALRR